MTGAEVVPGNLEPIVPPGQTQADAAMMWAELAVWLVPFYPYVEPEDGAEDPLDEVLEQRCRCL